MGVCARLRYGGGRAEEAHEDSLNTALPLGMCGRSEINFKIPGSEAIHPTSQPIQSAAI